MGKIVFNYYVYFVRLHQYCKCVIFNKQMYHNFLCSMHELTSFYNKRNKRNITIEVYTIGAGVVSMLTLYAVMYGPMETCPTDIKSPDVVGYVLVDFSPHNTCMSNSGVSNMKFSRGYYKNIIQIFV